MDCFDPWTQVFTKNGYCADEVISSLQKCIRRGNSEVAARFAYEMYITSEALEEMLWRRLQVISVEDIGFGAVYAPILVETLNNFRKNHPYGSVDRPLFFVHAIRYLSECSKTRSSDLLKNIIEQEFLIGIYPEIPDIALDMHTRRGRELGRDLNFFYEQASFVSPACEKDEPDYYEQLKALLNM